MLRTVAQSCLDPGHSASGFVPLPPLGYMTASSSLFSKWWHPSRMPKLGIFVMFADFILGEKERYRISGSTDGCFLGQKKRNWGTG